MDKWISVSIVEDLKDIREHVKRVVDEADGFICLSIYSNAEDAITEIPALQPDIVLMDINLPGMSGIDCILKIKEQCRSTQFMMFTIYEDSEQVFDSLSAGANGYLLKKRRRIKYYRRLKNCMKAAHP
jgi:DNA-binding NarL/FixJ family response regulator